MNKTLKACLGIASVIIVGYYLLVMKPREEQARDSNELEQVDCAACGYVFDDTDEAMSIDSREPCPQCGATARKAHARFEAELKPTSSLHGVGYTGRKANWFAKFWSRTELFKLSNRYHKVERSLNKRADEYNEVIHDAASGELVREVHEPLSKHQGHGSAKKKS
jgi:predicted  nucleic acid-binding Zn-ribbon protein